MKSHNNSVFVTGGTGLVGSHLICKLIEQGKHVRATCRENSNKGILKRVIGYYHPDPDEMYRSVEWVECDICGYDRLAKSMKGAEVVFHCAGVVSFEDGRDDLIIKNNVEGTANVVRACLENNIKHLCHVSSNSALRFSDDDSFVDETNKWDEHAIHPVYWTSKHLAEEEVFKGIAKGLSAVIVNPTIIIGPGDWSHGSSSFFSNIDRGMLFSSSGITGFVDVNDVVNAMIILTEKGISGERFLLNSENISYHRFFTLIAQSLGVRRPLFNVPKGFKFLIFPFLSAFEFFSGRKLPVSREVLKSAWRKVRFDNRKIIKETGISFTPIEKSIEKTAAIYLAEKNAEKSRLANTST